MSTLRSAHELTEADIVLGHFTLERHHDIEDRVRAAADAGCAGIGLYIRDYEQIIALHSPAWLRDLLDEHSLCLAEIEVLRGWNATNHDDAAEYAQLESVAFEMAGEFDSRCITAIGPCSNNIAEAGAAFAGLCDRAADYNLAVALEFFPINNIATAADAMRIVEAADRDNGGLCVDIWHHERGANDIDLIRAVPGDRIMSVQINDGPLTPTLDSYYEDCLRTRVPPGDGQMDVAGFIAAISASGCTVPWDLEVCNETVWDSREINGHDWVQLCASALRNYLP